MSDAARIAGGILDASEFWAPEGVSLEEGFDLQDAVVTHLAARLGGFAGYKIAWNVPHLMERFNMSHPAMGRIFSDQVYRSPATLPGSDFMDLCLEIEIAVVLSKDIPASTSHSPETIAAFMGLAYPSLEVIDRRGGAARTDAAGIIAGNVFNAGIVLGGDGVPYADLDVDGLHASSTCRGETVLDGTGTAPQSPAEAVAFLANFFGGRGAVMEAGQIIMCGSHIPLYAAGTGDVFEADMGALGTVSLTVT
jgi:2-keto-4-pentenoate hydratase